jgi:hypothetical protein
MIEMLADVLNSKEAKLETGSNTNSFLHITKAEIDLPDNIDIHSQQVYDKAKMNLEAFIQQGILFREEKPCYYIYQLVMKGRSQTGLVCASSVTDYEKGIIKKHEFTRPEKELDRINHIKTTGAQTGNVFLAYRNVAAIDALIQEQVFEEGEALPIVGLADDETLRPDSPDSMFSAARAYLQKHDEVLKAGAARFEGNSLVITLTNFNSYTWFDMAGNFHSDALKVVERYTPINADTLQYEATMTDPKVFTRPWTLRMTIQRQKDIGILDYECTAMLDEMGIHHTWPRDFDVN